MKHKLLTTSKGHNVYYDDTTEYYFYEEDDGLLIQLLKLNLDNIKEYTLPDNTVVRLIDKTIMVQVKSDNTHTVNMDIFNQVITESRKNKENLYVSFYKQQFYRCVEVDCKNSDSNLIKKMWVVNIGQANHSDCIETYLCKLTDDSYSINVNGLLLPINNKNIEFREIIV